MSKYEYCHHHGNRRTMVAAMAREDNVRQLDLIEGTNSRRIGRHRIAYRCAVEEVWQILEEQAFVLKNRLIKLKHEVYGTLVVLNPSTVQCGCKLNDFFPEFVSNSWTAILSSS